MQFELLPDGVISRLLYYLATDSKSFRNFSATCKRYQRIARQFSDSSEWAERRPVTFDLTLDLSLYSPSLCNRHGACAEQQLRYSGSRCELGQKSIKSKRSNSNQNDQRPSSVNNYIEEVRGDREDETEYKCYYHRLFALMNAKHLDFSRLKFKDAHLIDRGCIRSFKDTAKFNRLFAAHKIRALVELQLFSCNISLDWLNTILNELTNISYLTLDEVAFIDPCILVEPTHYASKLLRQLKITGDRTCRMTDSIFVYFFENFPTEELDLTGTRVEYHKRIIQRFYSNENGVEMCPTRPCEQVLTFPMILYYLKKYQAVVKSFIADETNITFTSLKKILQDEDLKHLRITIKNCPLITPFELTRLSEQLEESDIARVTF